MRLQVRFILARGLAMALAAHAQLTNFSAIDYPGSNNTAAIGINDAGDVVGGYFDRDNRRHGFLLRAGKFISFDVPASTYTAAMDINAAGDVVGFYIDPDNNNHGFLLSAGRFTTIDHPGSDWTRTFGINAKGEVVGCYRKSGGSLAAFLLSGGRFTEISYPEASTTGGYGINDQGDIVGTWNDAAGKTRGYSLIQGKFSSIEFPGSQATTVDLSRISNAGHITAPYRDARGKTKSLLLSGGLYTSFEAPGATSTTVLDINASGQIVGHYTDGGGRHGFVTSLAPPSISQPTLVDDDGADCPGAVSTIQEAVRRATPGATILVCRGLYTGAVNITGPEKNGLKLITTGRTHDVVLQGDYLARDGFHLENVSNVLIRGFTVRDFGNKATTDKEWGAGHLVYLENAHYNTIEQNHFFNSDRAAVMLVDSAHNVVQQNVATADNTNLATTGIEVQGAKSASNVIRLNMTYNNKLGGILIAGAGAGNVVTDNTVVGNGRYGIDVRNTGEVQVEGNRVSYNRGFWGTTPGGREPGLGINLENLVKATVFDNRARSNSGADLSWDGKGDNRLEANACDTCLPASACGR